MIMYDVYDVYIRLLVSFGEPFVTFLTALP